MDGALLLLDAGDAGALGVGEAGLDARVAGGGFAAGSFDGFAFLAVLVEYLDVVLVAFGENCDVVYVAALVDVDQIPL